MATKKQEAAMKKLIVAKSTDGRKKTPMSKIMTDAGYSPVTATHPSKLTQSDGWAELLEKYLPDEMLTRKLNEGLEANKQLAARVIFKKEAPTSQSAGELPLANSQTDDFIEVPDMAVRHKYMETALKVKGKLVERKDITTDGEKLEAVQVVIVEDNSMANE